jgi:flagellar hook-associated protein 2
MLGSLTNAMKMSMISTVSINGKNYSLASYGIQTSTDYTEKGLLHIYGDKDDATYGDKNDKLKKAFQDDPDTTMKALTGIFKNLYDTMADKMKAIPNVRSTMTFYDDKLIDKQQEEYKSKIKVQEKKLTEMENKYYKQFSAMETAMAKMQSQSNALAGLLGSSGK